MTISEEDFRKILQQEFEQRYGGAPEKLPADIDAVVVLAQEDYNFPADDIRRQYTKELISRVEYAVELLKDYPMATVLILEGARVQLPMMKKCAIDAGVEKKRIRLLNHGEINKANTKTQFEILRKELLRKKIKKTIIVTSMYHAPRVLRTASALLPEDIAFDVFGVPNDTHLYNKLKNINGEIERIIKYSQKGDISAMPR
jgi:uncharacterized SAM-binding protein YcdF (DUF218 family)